MTQNILTTNIAHSRLLIQLTQIALAQDTYKTYIVWVVFESRVLRRVFGPKRDVVTGDWRELHNEELNDLYSLPNIVRVVKLR
jgi:hypothetical protein